MLDHAASSRKPKTLFDDDSSNNESSEESGARLRLSFQDTKDGVVDDLTVNKEYARRFEHNKKREELERRKKFVYLFRHH